MRYFLIPDTYCDNDFNGTIISHSSGSDRSSSIDKETGRDPKKITQIPKRIFRTIEGLDD